MACLSTAAIIMFESVYDGSSQASFKALGCSYNCKRLTYGSFQLTHVTWWPRCSIDRAMVAKMKTNHYYSAHKVATRVSFGRCLVGALPISLCLI